MNMNSHDSLMNPVYLPYTYIRASLLSVLNTCFSQTVVYQAAPSQPLPADALGSASDILEIRLPAAGEEDIIEKTCRDYRRWLQLNPGCDRELLKISGGRAPFWDETTPSNIIYQIRGGRQSESADQSLLAARIFLVLAQLYDRQQSALNQDMVQLARQEEALMRELRGGEALGKTGARPDGPPPAAEYMVEKRLKAWARLLLADTSNRVGGLFITDSRAVWELLLAEAPSARLLFQGLPAAADQKGCPDPETLRSWFAEELPPGPGAMVDGAAPDRGGRAVLTIYGIPDLRPAAFFAKVAGTSEPAASTGPSALRNTLIAHLECGF